MPRRICICIGCPGCSGRPHTYDKDSSPGRQRCAPCQQHATRQKEASRPTAAQRGYGAGWRKASADVTAAAQACHWCGKPFTTTDPATADHVVPLARGGTHDRSNLVAAHRTCNSSRGGKLARRRR